MKINREQVNDDNSKLKQVYFKVDREDGDVMDRFIFETYMYPNYENEIHIKTPSIGFTLDIADAKILNALLTESLKEFKD